MATDENAEGAPLVSLERLDGNVALLRLENGKFNPLSQALLRQLRDVVLALKADLPGALVVTGNEKAFAAGAEIGEFGGPDEARAIGAVFTEAFAVLESFPRVTIAAVNGVALGGGCELSLCCDLRIASETARFGQPEIQLGIIPGGGGTQRLPRLIGPSRAKDMILTGRHVKADEALRFGLVDEVVPAAELLDHAIGKAAELAKGPLVAHALAKAAIDGGLDRSLADGIVYEQEMFVKVFETDDARIGVRSFLEHGPNQATFTGR